MDTPPLAKSIRFPYRNFRLFTWFLLTLFHNFVSFVFSFPFTVMSSQAGHSISPAPGPASTGNSGVRRHHTISASSRNARPTSKIQGSELEDGEQEEIWDQDEYVAQDWRGGIGAVGEKSSLHRQASLPTKYHRGEYRSPHGWLELSMGI